jgi:hypothetical protein
MAPGRSSRPRGKVAGSGGRFIGYSESVAAEIVTTALTLTFPGFPAKLNGLKRPTPKERCPHRHMPGRAAPDALSEIIGSQGSVHGLSTKSIDELTDAVLSQDNVIVDEHEPRR